MFYVVFFFILSLAYPTIKIWRFVTDENLYDDAAWLAGPNSMGALGISIFLKPRNNTPKYRALLFTQAFISLVVPCIAELLFCEMNVVRIGKAMGFVVLLVGLVRFALMARRR